LAVAPKSEENAKRRQLEQELEEMLGADTMKNLKGGFENPVTGNVKKERQKLTDIDKVIGWVDVVSLITSTLVILLSGKIQSIQRQIRTLGRRVAKERRSAQEQTDEGHTRE
jgi:cell division protein FtsL